VTPAGAYPRLAGRPVPSERLGGLRPSRLALPPETLAARLAGDGYVYLPGVLDTAAVAAARGAVLAPLARVGEVAEPAGDAIATGTSERDRLAPDRGAFLRAIAETPELRAVTHGPDLAALTAAVLGAETVPFDFLWLRTMPPGRASPLHVDHVYMNRGTWDVVTAWVPIGDVPAQDGPLFLVEGSHRFDDIVGPLRGLDVDRDGAPPGALDRDPVALAAERGVRLLTADFRAGDVVIFGMFVLHASFDNASPAGRVRVSCDARWQRAADARDPRFFGAPPTGHKGESYGGLSAARPLTESAPPR